jgi:hypothetical protein
MVRWGFSKLDFFKRVLKTPTMKKLLLALSLLFVLTSFSQEKDTTEYKFDQEWYDNLDSPLEYIAYKNPYTGHYSIRVYRGTAKEHLVTIKDYYGNVVHTEIIDKNAELDLFFLQCGYYIIEIKNDKSTQSQLLQIR